MSLKDYLTKYLNGEDVSIQDEVNNEINNSSDENLENVHDENEKNDDESMQKDM